MARLTVFCLETELNGWLRLLSTHYHLAALVVRRDHQGGIIRPVGAEDLVEQQVYRLFILPHGQEPAEGMSMNNVASRDRGYLDIEPGGLVDVNGERSLLYSQIVGEDFVHEPVHPA
jgi:hypothetical protein